MVFLASVSTSVGKKSHKTPHAIIKLLNKYVNICWFGLFQGAEVAFDVFDSSWRGEEGDTSHSLSV